MSFTRTKYDSCEKSASCSIPRGTGEYIMDINRFENTTTCNINKKFRYKLLLFRYSK